MAYREVSRMEIREIIRRWRAGAGPRQIATGTGLSRNTVRKYLAAAKAEGITQEGPDPNEEQLSRLAVISQSRPRQVATPRCECTGEAFLIVVYQVGRLPLKSS